MDEWGERGQHVRDDMLLVLLNAYWEPIPFTLPSTPNDQSWEVFVDTTAPHASEPAQLHPGATYNLGSRSLALLVCRVGAATDGGDM